MRGRQKEDDSSVPVKDGDWLYWWAYAPGAEYRTWYRRPVAGGAAEILVDEPADAAKGAYFRRGAMEASPSGQLLAWWADDDGWERFKLQVGDPSTGQDMDMVQPNAFGRISSEERRAGREGGRKCR